MWAKNNKTIVQEKPFVEMVVGLCHTCVFFNCIFIDKFGF